MILALRFSRFIEIGALFGALLLVIPYIPSHDGWEYPFGISQWIALVLFGLSRALRWVEKWWIAVPETVAFACFAFTMVASYDIIWSTTR